MVNKSLIKQTFSAIKLLLVITCFTSFSFSAKLSANLGDDIIIPLDWDQSSSSVDYTASGVKDTKKFRVDFPNNEVPRSVKYAKVELTVTNEVPTPILHFATKDSNCESDRLQIAKNPNSKTATLWLKDEEFRVDELYVCVQLVSSDSADYKLSIKGAQEIDMDPNFTYSYLVGSGNREQIFYAKLPENTPNSVTFYAVGSNSISLTVDNKSDVTKFPNGAAVTLKPEKTSSEYYSITVKANEGNYVTVGTINVIDGKSQGDLLQPNGLEVSGLLVRDVLNDQCFEMSTLEDKYNGKKIYLNGRFYNRIAEVYLRDSSNQVIDKSVKLVTDGFYTSAYASTGKKASLCVRFPEESYNNLKNIPFTLYATEHSSIESQYKFYPPQNMGEIYRRILPKGGIQFFSSLSPPKGKRITFNVKAKSGFPKMYWGRCNNYPQCNFPETELKNMVTPDKANRMYSYTYNDIDDPLPLSNSKYVIVVQCVDDDNAGSGYCEFETSFTAPDNQVEIVENETFGQFAVKGDKGTFKINLEGDSDLRTVNIDIMVLSGDISFTLKGDEDLSYHKYFLSNKVYFKISTEENKDLKTLTFEYTATLNSYYTFKWNANRRRDGGTAWRDYIVSGYSYLVDIDPTSYLKSKTVKLQNLRHKDSKPFLANFYALNCGFKLTREGKDIPFFDGYAQEIVTPSSDKYSSDYYDYVLNITETDLSNYNHKMCMIYIAGAETHSDQIESEILIGENIEQQFIFENGYNVVRFLYPHPDITKELALKVNVIDTSIYKVTVFAHRQRVANFDVGSTQIFHLEPSLFERHCAENSLCAIVIQVELSKKLVETNPMASITIRPFLNTPTYFEKSQAKQDFVCGTRNYYLYTDIGKNEEGEILVDFLRGKGEAYAKVVRKDQTSAEEEANWRGIYRMPSEEWGDSIRSNSYLKKLIVGTEETSDCIEGCYLLISINLALSGEYVEDYRFIPFLILTRITPSNRAYTDIPKVVIQVDEYIVGNVDISENERIYEFYEVWLPHDSQAVEFDWQSEVAGLYINLGGIRPTIKNADFKLLPYGKDEVQMLTKQQIIDKAKAKNIPLPYDKSIQDLSLVIGIWTDKTDSVDTEPYSLRVHQPMDNDIDIIKVNSDQKILCRPSPTEDNKLRCLFMVVFQNSQVVQNLVTYGASTDKSATNRMYAKIIDKEMYDEYNVDELRRNIPTNENSDFNSQKDGVDYIFASSIAKEKYLYVSVVTDSAENVMFLTGFGTFDFLVFPNSSSEKIFLVLPIHQISLQFNADQDIVASIVCLAGQGEFYWGNFQEQVYYLNGPGDRLIITSGKDIAENRRSNLMVTNRKAADKEKVADVGFVFYISYYLRKPETNFDEVYLGKSMEMAYKNTDLPVSLYAKIQDNFNDINIVASLKDDYNIIKDNENVSFEDSPIKIRSSVIKESLAYLAKKEPDLISLDKSRVGAYDPVINVAQGFLSIQDVQKFNVKDIDNPTLYVGLFKNDINKLVYEQFNLEVQVSKSNDGVPALEGVYNYGKVGVETDRVQHKLKIDKYNKIMRIHVSSNSASLGCIIADDEAASKNITFTEAKQGNGKSIVTLTVPDNKEYLYLIFYIKNKSLGQDRRLNNYCFKYMSAELADDFKNKEYKINDRKVKFTEQKEGGNTTTIKAEFDKVVAPDNVNITYAFKVVPNKTHVYKESIDTIAVSESPAAVAYIKNPKNSRITLEVKGADPEWVSLQVTATIKNGNDYEYETYIGDYHLRENRDNGGSAESSGVDTMVFIIVGGILLLIVIGLVVAVIIFKNRNKTLLNQVKHVSFQKTNSNTDPNLLLQKNQAGSQA